MGPEAEWSRSTAHLRFGVLVNMRVSRFRTLGDHNDAPPGYSPDQGEVDLGAGRVVLQLDQDCEQLGTQEVDQGNDSRGQVLQHQKKGLLWGGGGQGSEDAAHTEGPWPEPRSSRLHSGVTYLFSQFTPKKQINKP